jgi:putative endopeptidase
MFQLPIPACVRLASSRALFLTILAIIAFGALAPAAAAAATAAPPQLSPQQDPLARNLDPTVKPGDDFFRYATGTWLKANPIPPSERGWGIGNLVEDEIYLQLRDICEAAAAANAAPVASPHGTVPPQGGSSDQKVGDFWAAAMDSARIETQGIEPLRADLDRVAAIRSREDLLATMALFRTYGVGPLYRLSVSQDDKNSSQYVVFLSQGGIRLPDRGYYFGDDASTRRIREEYPRHIAAMFRLLGEDTAAAEQNARSVVALETALARASRTLEQRRDPWANYHKTSMGELGKLTPSIDWKSQFRALGIPPVDSVVVGQPEFFTLADSVVAAVPLDTWRAYLRWGLASNFAEFLSRSFDLEDFRFYGTVMGGTAVQRPRWKRVLDAEEGEIGELMGQVWARKYCSPATKARYEKLVDDIFAAYRDRIRRLDWMSASTKDKALAKLARVNRKVGYPDKWRDYSTLEIGRGSFVQNVMRANQWWFRYRVGKLGRPVDRTEWDMTPQTYNAYYDGSKVEIVLPAAAFLIPGVPDSLIDDAVLYSYAGASTIGHEITHGFDDEGRQYDADGNMKPWWTAADSAQFAQRARLLVEQFDQYKIGDLHVRGFATLGENIADLGGIVIAYEAFQKTDQWKKGEKLNGLTPDQRFFLGYALAWLGDQRPEALSQQIMTDVHAPRDLRVNGPLANIPEFLTAFGIRAGEPMWRPDSLRVKIW